MTSMLQISSLLLLLLLTTTLSSVRAQDAGDFISDPAENDIGEELAIQVAELDEELSVAHIGNSIQFYNDCPRLLQRMLKYKYKEVISDSCFRGGANVTRLFNDGNGMEDRFDTPNALLDDGTFDIGAPNVTFLLKEREWDYVIINDHTQGPVREVNRTASMDTLQNKYLPLIGDNTMVILLMTAAYRAPAKHSGDLGGFYQFTELLDEGYDEYEAIFPQATVAHFGLAFKYIRDNYGKSYWNRLYAPDDFHPSPMGTFLEASVLFCTITGEMPPEAYDETWWSNARYLDPPMPFPSKQDAAILREVAGIICGIEEPEEVPPNQGFNVILALSIGLLLSNIVLCRFLQLQKLSERQKRKLRDSAVSRPNVHSDSSSSEGSGRSAHSLSEVV
ncbi:unnamed protein product [Cylindrotheca closterium]|uniref:SGNH hydrolase-type esterase domain-containing protein n=1 Tax=Cylindrotheca closterium TaxID=2856 RepID=A0AAD2CW21_9STRA|nr:unnamed protein product [Cylindrotheca closterium]